MLYCLVWICSPNTCFCMYSWESLKSELCHNTHPPSSQRRSPTEIHVQIFYHLCASCQWPKVTFSCLCYANRMRTTLDTDCSLPSPPLSSAQWTVIWKTFCYLQFWLVLSPNIWKHLFAPLKPRKRLFSRSSAGYFFPLCSFGQLQCLSLAWAQPSPALVSSLKVTDSRPVLCGL